MTGATRKGLEAQIHILRQEKESTTVMLRFLADRIDELERRRIDAMAHRMEQAKR